MRNREIAVTRVHHNPLPHDDPAPAYNRMMLCREEKEEN